jgi:hypothetical protein
MHHAYNSRFFFSMQYLRLLTITSLYAFLINRSIQLITAKLTKYSLSLSLNLYLRLMKTKYNEGMNYASCQHAFLLARHKYAAHKTNAAYSYLYFYKIIRANGSNLTVILSMYFLQCAAQGKSAISFFLQNLNST